MQTAQTAGADMCALLTRLDRLHRYLQLQLQLRNHAAVDSTLAEIHDVSERMAKWSSATRDKYNRELHP